MASGLQESTPPRSAAALAATLAVLAVIQRSIWPRRVLVKGAGGTCVLEAADARLAAFAFDEAGGPPSLLAPLANLDPRALSRVAAGLAAACAGGVAIDIAPTAAAVAGKGADLDRLLAAILPPVPGAADGAVACFHHLMEEAGRPSSIHDGEGWPCYQPGLAALPLDDIARRAAAVSRAALDLSPRAGGDGPSIGVWIAAEAGGNWALARDRHHIVVLPRIANDMASVLAAWKSSSRRTM